MKPEPRLPPDTDIKAFLLSLSVERRALAVSLLGEVEADALERDWPFWRHEGQYPATDDWTTWIIKAGRGFGKTRAGAEWIRAHIKGQAKLSIALVGATLDDARKVMIEGPSGLLSVADAWIKDWLPSRGLLVFKNESEARLFSGATPEMLRGPEHHIAWCDELAKWEKAQETWDMLQFTMRKGKRPQVVVTTTPLPGPVLEKIMRAKHSIVTSGRTHANPHLPKAYIERVEDLYAGTRLGRQEIDGELLSDVPGALWRVELLEACRVKPSPLQGGAGSVVPPAQPLTAGGSQTLHRLGDGESNSAPSRLDPNALPFSPALSPLGQRGFTRIVIGVDPPAGDGTCGIIVCAMDADGMAHVLADHSVTARTPQGWALAVASAARLHGANLVVAENNQGGAMVSAVLHGADARLRVKPVTARTSKSDRAVPVAQAFEAGKVRLHGRFPELEAQLCGLIGGGGYEGPGRSPDRADAMVWALTELLPVAGRATARVRVL